MKNFERNKSKLMAFIRFFGTSAQRVSIRCPDMPGIGSNRSTSVFSQGEIAEDFFPAPPRSPFFIYSWLTPDFF